MADDVAPFMILKEIFFGIMKTYVLVVLRTIEKKSLDWKPNKSIFLSVKAL